MTDTGSHHNQVGEPYENGRRSVEISPNACKNPRDVNAWFETGKMLREMQRYDEALVAYDQAIAADPDWAGAWSDKVIVLGGCARSN